MVLIRQVVPQQAERGQVDRSAFDQLMDEREPTQKPRGSDAAEGFALTHAEFLRAKFEHARKRSSEMEAALFDLSEQADEPSCELALGADELFESREQFIIGQIAQMFHI
ncbi:MAG TPA: hypothetical protein VGJ84_10590 [Polyangiaceae bacterium]